MQPLKKRSTTIHEDTRRMLAISRDAYAFCDYVHYRCADSRQKRAGWCCDNKQELADFVGLTRPGLYKMGERLVEIGLLEMSSFGDYRATPQWIDADAKCKQSLQNSDEENVNKVYKKRKQSLQNSGENVNFVYNDTYILELENKREKLEEKTALSPDKKISSLEESPGLFNRSFFILDEAAEILSNKDKKFEEQLCKLAPKCRAAGIHLIIATQRPSADILNGLIKNNFPGRIACRTSSKIDSQIILDTPGAEALLGKGQALMKNSAIGLSKFQIGFINPKDVVKTYE